MWLFHCHRGVGPSGSCATLPQQGQTGSTQSNSKPLFRIIPDQQGVSMLEFTIVAPILFALCFGVIQYSLALFAYNNMFDAAREAARELAVGTSDETEAEATALSRLVDWPTNWNVVAQDVTTTGTKQVKVTITVPGQEAGILSIVPMPAELRAEVVMRKE